MKVGRGASRTTAIIAGCLLLTLQMSLAQKKPVAAAAENARAILLNQARALDSRGRPDMAIQLWQQILLSDPNSADALAGLAKDLKLTGAADKANETLDRLRQVNPNDPNIAKIQAMASTKAESSELKRAGQLASQGKVDDAMQIYRQLYGDHPPDGDIALAYYQTLYGTSTGKQDAIAGMRALAARNPGDPRFAVELGVMLTYDARTRADGIRILKEHPNDINAQAALRQALVWDSANPTSAGELRQYLKEHPQDTELSSRLRENEAKLAQMNSGIARTPAERTAFAALNAHRLDEAEKRFVALLQTDPNNGRVAAGMGFLRMQQKNFGGAISYLTQAEQDGYKARTVAQALATSRFWYTMGEASQAFAANQFDVAAAKYKAALVMNPRSPEALNGLAGLLIREEQYPAAAGVYEQLVRQQPGNLDGWRGLFMAYARNHQNKQALAISARFPASVRSGLTRDPEYLRTLALLYQSEGRSAEAERVLAEALALPFPNNGAGLRLDTKLQYAGILMQAKRYDQAAPLYSQILMEDSTNVPAWEGLVSADHGLGQDTQAIAIVQKMPPAAYEASLGDPGFLTMLAAIYQQANQYEIAQSLLERAERLQIATGGQPSIAIQMQMAGIYLLRNNTDQAYAIYRRVLRTNPDSSEAWQGLISSLQATNRNSEALQEIAQMPPAVRKQLESSIEFQQTEASLYATNGDTVHALQYMNRVNAHYARLKMQPPANIAVQNAWLLYNTSNDRALYPVLMSLGGRSDLTGEQRQTVQTIWASWSVRRASAAMANGDAQRAEDILDAALQAFPNNLAVRKAVAGGYAQVGRSKEAVALFKAVPMQNATSGDFQGAIGAALAANDKTQAEQWLRQGLDRFPRDPAMLALAARYEQARGDNQRAADYWRASLAVMPASSPVDRLAHTLVYPEQDLKTHRAVTAADLQRLLNPEDEPFAKTTKLPPLPAYGIDPYNSPPVVLNTPQPTVQRGTSVQSMPQQSMPVNQQPVPEYNPAVNVIPSTQAPSAPLYQPQSFIRYRDGLDAQSLGRTGARLRYATYRPVLQMSGLSDLNAARVVLAAIRRVAPLSALAIAGMGDGQAVDITPNPPHSLASDAWKGLIFSLMSSGHNAEALKELGQVPPDQRRLLDQDIEFVQGIASLYVAVGDTPHAMEYLNRVESYYSVHRTTAPAGLELQHAWLLYNIKDDVGLYPVLQRLDQRQDLTAQQREQLDTIWSSWAVRRAGVEMDNGHMMRGVEILQAASQDYPNNMNVRRAVAGAYARVGRYDEALSLFKAMPFENASVGDYQGAISAAMGAGDMAQAEKWLRQALAKDSNDPQVLELAARFEQARGNSGRAADFWRAALAAMPPGSPVQGLLNTVHGTEGSTYQTPAPGATKQLLDPRNEPLQPTDNLPALPSYQPQPTGQNTGQSMAPSTTYSTPTASQQRQWIDAPSNDPLPLPSINTQPSQAQPMQYNPAAPSPPTTNFPVQQERQYVPSNAPIYVPQGAHMNGGPSEPVLIEQNATQDAVMELVSDSSRTRRKGTAEARNRNRSNAAPMIGEMHLTPLEENIDSTGAVSQAPAVNAQQVPIWTPSLASHDSNPAEGLRITSQPMGAVAAQVQALFAEQTDAQLTQGSASMIHSVSNAAETPAVSALPSLNPAPASEGRYNVAQYTPSAQEAVTGAYSAPKQTNIPAQTQQQSVPLEKPLAVEPRASRRMNRARRQKTPTLGNAPALSPSPSPEPVQMAPAQQEPQQVQTPYDIPSQQQTSTGDTGLSDQELEQRNLPPLRGPWVRIQRQARSLSPRDEAEMQLRAIESGYSGWLGGTGMLNYRSGNLGFDRLTALESPFEVSVPLGGAARFTVVARPVFLDSGQADGTAVLSVLEPTTAGTSLTTIPEPIGTLTGTDTKLPAQQNAAGIGGEIQLAFPTFAIAAGYTPYGFLVSTFTGRLMWRPANGPITFNFSRDSVKDSQLSYAGLRDPAGDSLGTLGQIWGGVMSNQGSLQYARGNAQSGFYMGAGGQYLTGYKVESNKRFDVNGGAYWRVLTQPEYGNLSIGANFFAMHYANNQGAFTHGMGGYFSPQAYFLANVPFTWAAHYGTRLHYNIMGALGVQAFQVDRTPLWPLLADKPLETSQNNPYLPAMTSVGSNYDLRGQIAYQLGPHWFAGGYFGANNTRNYSSASVGFFVRYMFRSQPSTVTSPTGLFPSDGLRPFTVP